jgi:hypothetical protein
LELAAAQTGHGCDDLCEHAFESARQLRRQPNAFAQLDFALGFSFGPRRSRVVRFEDLLDVNPKEKPRVRA